MTAIHNVGQFPEGRWDYFELSELDDDYDLRPVRALNIDEAWYWYGSGSYEGTGLMLMRRGDLYDFASLGHCSCYGPTDYIRFDGKPFDKLVTKASDELLRELRPLLAAARPETYGGA